MVCVQLGDPGEVSQLVRVSQMVRISSVSKRNHMRIGALYTWGRACQKALTSETSEQINQDTCPAGQRCRILEEADAAPRRQGHCGEKLTLLSVLDKIRGCPRTVSAMSLRASQPRCAASTSANLSSGLR